jgi:hypothetical protein
LDTISFGAGFTYSSGGFYMSAPNGTLSDGSLPDSLNAFVDYAQNHPTDGYFDFAFGGIPGGTEYTGQAIGFVGGVPEPSTLVSMSIGLSFILALLARRNRMRSNRLS